MPAGSCQSLETCRPASSSEAVPPKLAVVIVCYNYGEFVGRAIDSVLAQDRQDCEVVVIDDGSLDGSWDVIRRTGVRAYRIQNSGARRACLHGFDRTTAPFVLFLDADDELRPDSIRSIIERLDAKVAKLQVSMERIDAKGDPIQTSASRMKRFREREKLERRILRTGVYDSPPTSGNVFRRDLCELLRDAEYDPYVDGVILFAAPFFGDVVSLSDVHVRYRIHSRNDSGLGRAPEARLVERDMVRFEQRLNHLRAILEPRGRAGDLIAPTSTFYFKERQFCLAIATGARPPAPILLSLLGKIWWERYSLKHKVAIATFLILAFVADNRAARSLMSYRYAAGDRSAWGFLKAAVT